MSKKSKKSKKRKGYTLAEIKEKYFPNQDKIRAEMLLPWQKDILRRQAILEELMRGITLATPCDTYKSKHLAGSERIIKEDCE